MGTWRAPAAAALLLLDGFGLAGPDEGWIPGRDLRPADRILLAVTLVLLAHGVAGHRRVAQYAALSVLTLVAVASGPHAARLVPLGAVVVLLLPYGDAFAVRPDPRRLRAAAAVAAGAVLVAFGRGVWEALGRRLPVRHAAYAALPLLPADPDRSTRVFAAAVLCAVLVALAVAMAAAPAPPPSGEAERARVRALVQRPGASSLAPFATRADRTYVFTPGGDGAIGYRVRFGVALAGGDPVGDAPGAIDAFAVLCATRGWRPAVLGADAALGQQWRRAGVRRAVGIGDEAVLDVATFSLRSRPMRNVRQAVRRAANAGVHVTVGPLVPGLEGVLYDWLRGRRERGFAMNLDAVLTPREDVIFAVARDATGDPVGFARFAVAGGGKVYSLDIAPRRRDAPNGVVESLIVATVDHARKQGATEVTLNFAGMRRVYAATSPGMRLVAVPLRLLDRWIELRSLYLFTAKFHPGWRPRQLRMRSWAAIVPVAAAALTAEFGAGKPVTPCTSAPDRTSFPPGPVPASRSRPASAAPRPRRR